MQWWVKQVHFLAGYISFHFPLLPGKSFLCQQCLEMEMVSQNK